MQVQVERKLLTHHLEAAYCDNEVGELILEKDFAYNAIGEDNRFVGLGPALAGHELPKRVGIPNLPRLIKFLRSSLLDGDTIPFTYTDDDRVEIEGAQGIVFSMLCANPKVIGTRMTPDAAKKIRVEVGKGTACVLTKAMVDATVSAISMLTPEHVSIVLSKKDGHLQVGDSLGDHISVPFTLKGHKDSYTVMLSATKLGNVLRNVTDYSQSELIVTGAHPSMVGVRDGEYLYVLTTMQEEAS